jgi:nicotinamide-nucleotide amidase
MSHSKLQECGKELIQQHLTIAFAESATAGRLSAEFSLVPDSGEFLTGGLVCYDACIKQDILGVPEELIKKYTPESAEVTAELARRLPKLIKSDIQVAVTGLTTEGGSESPEKPVGTMFMHIIIKGKEINLRKEFKGEPEKIVLQTVEEVAGAILKEIREGS